MIINEPAIDWLTLTTWSTKLEDAILRLLEEWAIEKIQPASRMQYQGFYANGCFAGQAEQHGRLHTMCQVSGMDAELMSVQLAYLPMKCTRIDLQLTCEKPTDFDAHAFAEQLRKWNGPGRARQITLVQSGDGYDTVYIGSRTSDRYIRWYVKPDADGKPYLRFEVEYKGELAVELWHTIRTAKDMSGVVKHALAGEILALPPIDNHIGSCFAGVLEGKANRPSPERKPSKGKRLEWLRKQVAPAIIRSMHDHDEGVAIRQLVYEWYLEAEAIDEAIGRMGIDE